MDCKCEKQGKQIRFIKRKMRPHLFCAVCMQLISRQAKARTAITAFERFKYRFIHIVIPQELLRCKWDNLRFAAKTILNEEISLWASHMKVYHNA